MKKIITTTGFLLMGMLPLAAENNIQKFFAEDELEFWTAKLLITEQDGSIDQYYIEIPFSQNTINNPNNFTGKAFVAYRLMDATFKCRHKFYTTLLDYYEAGLKRFRKFVCMNARTEHVLKSITAADNDLFSHCRKMLVSADPNNYVEQEQRIRCLKLKVLEREQ